MQKNNQTILDNIIRPGDHKKNDMTTSIHPQIHGRKSDIMQKYTLTRVKTKNTFQNTYRTKLTDVTET